MTDDNGCLFTEIITVLSNDLDVSIIKTDVTCFDLANGTATAEPAFGVGPCSYAWDDPMMQITPTAVDLSPGIYNVNVVHDAIGCSGTETITITEPDETYPRSTYRFGCKLRSK